MKSKLQDEIRHLLNGSEDDSNTPDYVLARYLSDCLESFNRAVNTRERFHGRDPEKFEFHDRNTTGLPIM